ncbi:MAG: EVE domain-containing protein [Planctomycetota bacterium]|nr:EVE domain-containing protein [Planctomycetota bacterium]
MTRAPRHWLFKSEPDVFSIQDLAAAAKKTTAWDGVRNYQARNLLRDDIAVGDHVLYYHSRVEPIGVAGLARVTRAGYADPTQFDAASEYHDAKADPAAPRWICVDIQWQRTFGAVVSLATLKATPALRDMMVVQRGARLSVQPVTAAEFAAVLELAAT